MEATTDRLPVALLTNMTRAKANEILDLWRAGAQNYRPHEITMALYVTGDLESPL